MSVEPKHPNVSVERPWVLHPFLVPLPLLLALTNENLDMATPAAPLYLYAVLCGMAALLMLVLGALLGNPRKAGAITSILLVALLVKTSAMGKWSLALWVGIAGLCLLVARGRGELRVLTTFLNIAAMFGSAIPIYNLVRTELQPHRPIYRPDYLTADAIQVRPATDSPDIYYIVLDGYGRRDVLESVLGIKNKLPAELEKRGFYIADRAHSNYSQTTLSLAATLNMTWIENLLAEEDKDSHWRRPLSHLIGKNRTVETLRQSGYRIIDYASDYSVVHLQDADASRRPWVYFTEFEYTFLDRTPLAEATRLFGLQESLTQAVRRNHVRWVLTDLQKGDREDGPAFVFAHILAPHPPFLFKPDGSYRPSNLSCLFFDGSHWRQLAEGSGESYAEGYADAIAYVDDMVLRAVDGILKSSKRPPIILIQGDHGPGSKLDWDSDKGSDLQERMSILSAYYFPDADYSRLQSDITPINSFRTVFSQFFGANLPKLDDRMYFNTWTRPYDPIDVTDMLAQ